jgi:hypothetical protein
MPLLKGAYDTCMGAIEIGGWITGRQPLPLRSRLGEAGESRATRSGREFGFLAAVNIRTILD